MGMWNEIAYRLRRLRRGRSERELDEEMRAHLELEVERNIEGGLSPGEARRAALRAFGSVLKAREESRDMWGFTWLERLWQDVRYGARVLLKRPGFTAVVVVTLALGIGANTAIFSLVYGVMLKPLPYAEPSRLVQVGISPTKYEGGVAALASLPEFDDWRKGSTSFEHMAAVTFDTGRMEAGEAQVDVNFAGVSPELFAMLRTQPILGRALTAEDASADSSVAVLAYDFWKKQFGGDPGVIGQRVVIEIAGKPGVVGRSLSMNTAAYTVVGVMPQNFKFPDNFPVQTYLPLPPEALANARTARNASIYGRLRQDVTLQQARAEMQTFSDPNRRWEVRVVPILDQYVGRLRHMFLSLLGAVGFLLLIACANIASLFLARGAARQREMAIRAALGASRGRLVRQMLTEGMLVAAAGGTAGLLIAFWGLKSLVAIVPGNVPRLDAVQIDAQVLVFTLFATALTGLLCGLAPALRSKDTHLSESLKDGGKGASDGAPRRRLHSALVVAEVALALVLLIGAGLMLKSFLQTVFEDRGFNSENVVTMNVQLPVSAHSKEISQPAQALLLWSQLLERVESMPGVESAALLGDYPDARSVSASSTGDGGNTGQPQRAQMAANIYLISADYFKTLKVPLLSGRPFDKNDPANSQNVAIVNQELARRLWPEVSPIGQGITIPGRSAGQGDYKLEVIGVAGNTQMLATGGNPVPEVYLPYGQSPAVWITIRARTASDPSAHLAAMGNQVREVSKSLRLDAVRTLDQELDAYTALTKFYTFVLTGFAGLALLLVTVGVYGVLSYSVSRRTQEIAIRMALGAQSGSILGMILRWGMSIMLIGVVIGLAGAFALTRFLTSQLYGVNPTDPLTFVGVSLLLVSIGFLACYLPARRATRVDPLIALRDE